MASPEAVREQIVGVLAGGGYVFSLDDDGAILVSGEWDGSTYVAIKVGEWDDLCLVSLVSLLLDEVPSESEKMSAALGVLNDMNREIPFGRVVYEADLECVKLEHEFVVDEYVEAQAMLCVLLEFGEYAAVADDRLQQTLGLGITTQDAFDAVDAEKL